MLLHQGDEGGGAPFLDGGQVEVEVASPSAGRRIRLILTGAERHPDFSEAFRNGHFGDLQRMRNTSAHVDPDAD
jgi:hypothetical protein